MISEYSKAADGHKQLSENFKVDEFSCNDGSDYILNDSVLVDLLQAIRDFFERSVTLNSGYRNEAYNASIGGATNSFHCQGKAADFSVAGHTPVEVRSAIESGSIKGCDPNKIGLGAYETFTHIDSRGYKARW